MEIIVSQYALKDSDQRLFAESRHRSQRIRKKLIKRFGGEFRKVPCIYQMGGKLVAHPTMYERLKVELAAKHKDTYERSFFAGYAGNPW